MNSRILIVTAILLSLATTAGCDSSSSSSPSTTPSAATKDGKVVPKGRTRTPKA